MEKQITLNGQEVQTNNNTTNWGVFNLHRKLILEGFYQDYTETGMSLVELNKKFKQMGENTIPRAIKFLMKHELIQLTAKNVGPTKRRKYYKITEKGASIYDSINSK